MCVNPSAWHLPQESVGFMQSSGSTIYILGTNRDRCRKDQNDTPRMHFFPRDFRYSFPT